MSAAPPHLDLLDYKPELKKYDGKDCPDEFLKGKRFAFTSGACSWERRRSSVSTGRPASGCRTRRAPGQVADELTVIKSMKTDEFNHAPAEPLLYTGSRGRGGRVSPRGLLWPRQRVAKPSRLRRPDLLRRATSGRGRGAGGAAFCRASSRACSAARRASRSSISPTRQE